MVDLEDGLLGGADSLERALKSGAIQDSRPIRVWHLSDPHFSSAQRFGASRFLGLLPGLRCHDDDAWAAMETLAQEHGPSDILIVSGDLSSVGTMSSLRFARSKILQLARTLGIASDDRIFVVPGNHDRLSDYFFPIAWRGARPFERVFGEYCLPRKLSVRQWSVCVFPFDSTEKAARLWPLRANTGIVTGSQFDAFNREVLDYRRSEVDLVIVVLHHHPLPVPSVYTEGLTVMRNGGAFMSHMHRQSIDLVLHGHMHRPYSCRISYRDEGQDTVIAAAGTVCQRGGWGRAASIVDAVPGERVTVKVFRHRETGFESDVNPSRSFRLRL